MEAKEALLGLSKAFGRIEVLNDALKYNPTVVSRSLQDLKVRMIEA